MIIACGAPSQSGMFWTFLSVRYPAHSAAPSACIRKARDSAERQPSTGHFAQVPLCQPLLQTLALSIFMPKVFQLARAQVTDPGSQS